jgi:hypothetical protein
MIRSLTIAALLATTATAQAQTVGGPSIAYVKVAGTASEIYLVNPDGSGSKKLYTAARKAGIGSIDLKPGGGELAFIERSGATGALKIISFDAQGNATSAPRSLATGCVPDYVDYHPSDALLLVTAVCGSTIGVGTIGTDGSGFALAHQGPTQTTWYGQARWLADGTYVYLRAVSASANQLCRNACEGSDLIFSSPTITRVDVARTRSDRALVDQGTPYVGELDFTTATIIFSLQGTDGHYSPDDQRILFKTPHAASGDYLHIRNADGSIFRLTGKGDYGAKDWRN